ncbi:MULTISPECIES: hypothetical protein [Xanthomonas]|uniref:hypothetical protein n=1 Tax=Xanthomonas TaxID=338 RepID=UPI001C45DBE1|nr:MULTISPECIES: hypothetical protein [Xanthomonas]MBV6867897.1 hypothetical protein [Xanthomonas campestris pv. coriandri]MCE4330817.1 hypothetical protein [Xanthomonas campestris pv. coriandri]MEA9776919.1 hypothetical protein [Xanthomonas campestris pv. raphani]
MGLWLFYCDAAADDIELACNEAERELKRRGFTAAEAQQAALDAADLAEDYSQALTPDADAVAAWFNAEDAAFRKLHELTREWPADASLIFDQD